MRRGVMPITHVINENESAPPRYCCTLPRYCCTLLFCTLLQFYTAVRAPHRLGCTTFSISDRYICTSGGLILISTSGGLILISTSGGLILISTSGGLSGNFNIEIPQNERSDLSHMIYTGAFTFFITRAFIHHRGMSKFYLQDIKVTSYLGISQKGAYVTSQTNITQISSYPHQNKFV